MKTFSIFLGLCLGLMLFGYIFVGHHRDVPDRIQQNREVLLGGGSGVAERIKPVGRVNVASAETAPTRQEPVPVVAVARVERSGQQVYESTCAVCHAAGIAGAPKVGDAGVWAKRVAKGLDNLYASAIKGVQGSAGVMPAKGGNAALSDAEVKSAVDYIVTQSK